MLFVAGVLALFFLTECLFPVRTDRGELVYTEPVK